MKTPAWMRYTLYLAGLYNLTWGTAVILFPEWSLRLGGLWPADSSDSPPVLMLSLWQCIGMIVGVYGIGYAIAGTNPTRHWPIVLVGWLGKIFGPIGGIAGILAGELPVTMLWTNLFNDVIWWIPFTLILYHAYRASLHEESVALQPVLEQIRSDKGATLQQLSASAPVLVVFLRHFG
jgi:hypothetical protein